MSMREELGTDSTSNMTERADYKYNHFHRLPVELIVSIFDKIADLKCLCHCSLVSRHFAAVVSRVQTVSVTVTCITTYDIEYLGRITKLVSELQNCNANQLQALLDSLSFQNMKLPVFLSKLTELKCVYLDYDYTEKSVNSPSPMRKIKFYNNGAKIESFVALESAYMHKDTENEVEEEEDYKYIFSTILRVMDSWVQFRVRYMEWICFVIMLIKCHASLQKVTVTDSEVHVKLVIRDELGVNLHIGVPVELLKQFSDCNVGFNWVPGLHLPLSGHVMRWVALTIVYLPESSCARAKNLDEIEFWDFDDELPFFREAVEEILKNHKDTLNIFRQ